jgi:hypothetical protein
MSVIAAAGRTANSRRMMNRRARNPRRFTLESYGGMKARFHRGGVALS